MSCSGATASRSWVSFFLQFVEFDDGFAAEFGGEDVVLQHVELVAEFVDDRLVVVDDEIENAVQRECRPLRQQFGFAFETGAHMTVGQRCAVAYGDQIAGTDESMGFAEADVAVQQLGGVHGQEQRVAVGFDLRPLMRVLGVFDREIVQAEFLLQFVEQGFLRLVQADPDEAAVVDGEGVADLVEADIGARAVAVHGAIDDALRERRSGGWVGHGGHRAGIGWPGQAALRSVRVARTQPSDAESHMDRHQQRDPMRVGLRNGDDPVQERCERCEHDRRHQHWPEQAP
jgi:hypothetical protein